MSTMIRTHDIERWLDIVNASPMQVLWELANGETTLDDFRSMVTSCTEEAHRRDPLAVELQDLLWEPPPYEREALAHAAIDDAYREGA
jgi:hypothetical protein